MSAGQGMHGSAAEAPAKSHRGRMALTLPAGSCSGCLARPCRG